jgi:hypothetical protein
MTLSTGNVLRLGLFGSAVVAGCVWAPAAVAEDGPAQADLGVQVDVGGGQLWSVAGLQPSTDVIPFAPAGTVWEATVTAAPVGGGIPVVPAFSARPDGAGQSYPVLWSTPTALGISPAPIAAGQAASGKIYFDAATTAPPASVAYTSGGRDTAVWVMPAAPAAESAPSYVSPSPMAGSQGPAAVTPQVPAAVPAPAAGSTGTAVPAAPRSAGTPLPAAPRSAGTPLPAGSTPAAAPAGPPVSTPAVAAPAAAPPSSPAAPAAVPPPPAATPSTPAPAAGGSVGTPLVTPTTTVLPAG